MIRRGKGLLALAAFVWAAASVSLARADEGDILTGTLKTIRDRGTILIGYRRGSVPFSFLNRAGQPIGFSVDLCRGIAADVARRLNRDLLEPDAPAWQVGIRMIFVPVQAAERIPKIVFGEIDLECGSTTATAERGKTVAFSPIFFLAGTKLLVPAPGGDKGAISSYRGLAGRSVAVSTGTTNLGVMQRLAGNVAPPMVVKEVPSIEAGYDALASGAADAFASDDVLLYGLAATRPDGKRFRVVGDFLSFEPYAILLRRDDPALSEVVRASFARMAGANMLGPAYNRWFLDTLPTGERMNLPISPQLAEMYRALGQPD